MVLLKIEKKPEQKKINVDNIQKINVYNLSKNIGNSFITGDDDASEVKPAKKETCSSYSSERHGRNYRESRIYEYNKTYGYNPAYEKRPIHYGQVKKSDRKSVV